MTKTLLNLFTGSLLLTCSVSIAQPTLSGTGTNPVIGESTTYTGTSYFSAGPSGASQTWNFATYTGTPSTPSNVVTVGSTPSGSSFPSANIAINTGGGAPYSYQKTSATAYQNYGNVASSGVVMSYSNPEDYLRFPFTYLNTYIDPWATTFVNAGYTFYRTGTTTITADGYGTLITAAGTFTNVTRVHMVQDYQDSAYFGTPYVITYLNDEYFWYVNGTHAALAATFDFTSSAGSPVQGSFFLGTAVGIDDINASLSNVNLFPNPATDHLTVDFTLTENKAVQVQVFNAIGQEMEISQYGDGMTGSNTIRLNVTDLPEGIYYAQIMLDGNIAATKRFVIAK